MQRVDELEKEIVRKGEAMTEMEQKHGERVDMMEARIQEIAKQTQESITDIINLMERALKQDPKPYQSTHCGWYLLKKYFHWWELRGNKLQLKIFLIREILESV